MQPPRVYRAAPLGTGHVFRQGEILSTVVQTRLDLPTLNTPDEGYVRVRHPLAVILTQDCDLEQDFKARQGHVAADKQIPSLLFCEVATAEDLYGFIKQTNKKLWDRIRINKDERYHFLQKVEPGDDALEQGLPEMGIDFKRYFTIPTDELYRRVELSEAQRRCILQSPYLEHLSSRFAYYLGRVALPLDHVSE